MSNLFLLIVYTLVAFTAYHHAPNPAGVFIVSIPIGMLWFGAAYDFVRKLQNRISR